MTTQEWIDVAKVAGPAVGGLYGVSHFAWAKLLRPKWTKVSKQIRRIPEALDNVEKLMACVLPNGGQSLADRMVRIEANTERIDETTTRTAAIAYSVDDAIDIAGCLIGADGQVIRANSAMGYMLGCSPTDLHGKEYINFINPDDRKALVDGLAFILGDKRSGEIENIHMTTRDRRKLVALWHLWPIEFKRGAPMLFRAQIKTQLVTP